MAQHSHIIDAYVTEGAHSILGDVRDVVALAYNVGMFLFDVVNMNNEALQAEADGAVWVVPNELRPNNGGKDGYVTADGTVTVRPRGAGQGAYNRGVKDGTIRPAYYVWVAEGINTETVASLMSRAKLMDRLASEHVRLSRVTGADVSQDVRMIVGEVREIIATLLSMDPRMRTVARESYPAYITDRIERMTRDNEGFHWSQGDTDPGA